MDLPSNALSANQDLAVDLLSTSVNEISRLIPLLLSLCHRCKCQTCKIYWKWLLPFTLWWKISIQKIYRSQSTSKYDRAKVSIETESRPLLSQLISYENLHMSENTVTLTLKENNETSRTGKGKYFTLGRCSWIRETYMYQSLLNEQIYLKMSNGGSKDKSLFPSHGLVIMTCCVICYGPFRTFVSWMSQRRDYTFFNQAFHPDAT